MTNTRHARLKNLGEVEQSVMDYIWSHGPSTAEVVPRGAGRVASHERFDDPHGSAAPRRKRLPDARGRRPNVHLRGLRCASERSRARGEEHHRPLLRRIGGTTRCSAWSTTKCSIASNWNAWHARSPRRDAGEAADEEGVETGETHDADKFRRVVQQLSCTARRFRPLRATASGGRREDWHWPCFA